MGTAPLTDVRNGAEWTAIPDVANRPPVLRPSYAPRERLRHAVFVGECRKGS
jgi:hypothetical protein